jgi:hypothetical protein
MNTRTALGLALLFGGVVLLAFGLIEADSFASDVSEVFTGSPTDRAVWLIAGGTATAVLGGVLSLTGRRSV